MDLLEYQAKELFHEVGIPVLPSQQIASPRDIKSLNIPYPVVLKSQVPTGGRGRAGGIKFVENTIDAIAAAHTIFHLSIMGEYPEVLLAEARYNAQRELYLAVALDYSLRRPVLLGSSQGGMDLDLVMKHLQQVVVEREFSSFYARRLAVKMGLEEHLIESVSAIAEKMFQLFLEKDLDLVEINPLGVSPTGELMALDGKVTANNAALARHPSLVSLAEKRSQRNHKNKIAVPVGVDFWELEGNIAIISNGIGLTMATLDLLHAAGGKVSCCLNLGEIHFPGDAPSSLCNLLERGLESVTQDERVKVVLVNILECTTPGDAIVKIIDNCVQRNGSGYHQFVLRLAGKKIEGSEEFLALEGVSVIENLDEAVAKAVALAKPSPKRR